MTQGLIAVAPAITVNHSPSGPCPVCNTDGVVWDGPSNWDIPTQCEHYICVECWNNIGIESLKNYCLDHARASCPICHRDVSNWLFSNSNYEFNQLSESEDENSDSEEDE